MKNRSKSQLKRVVALAAAVATAAVLGCSERGASREVKLGAILPLTGDLASYGARAKNAIELAVIEWNAGPSKLKVKVVYEDNVGRPKDTVSAYQKLEALDKVPLVFGAASSPETLALVPQGNRDQVVIFSSISSSPELTREGGTYFFRICPSDAYQAVIIADWMHEMNLAKLAVMYLNNSWGKELLDAFQRRFSEHGGTIVVRESCNSGDTDFRTQIAKMLASKPDAVWAPTYGKEGGVFLRQLMQAGYSGPVFGGDVWSSPELVETAREAAEGAYFCVPAEFAGPKFDAFSQAYKAKYGSSPDVYAALSYDMAKIACQAIGQGHLTGPALRQYLSTMPVYDGVSGATSFDRNGDVVGKTFSRKVYKQGQAVDL